MWTRVDSGGPGEPLDVLVRGWLHGNVAVAGDTVVDTGYHTGADAILDRCPQLDRIVLTHAHSDHAGGVAAICEARGARVLAHADVARLTDPWDARGLWLGPSGQHLPGFTVDEVLGDTVAFAGREWQVVHTPGHATGGVALYDGCLVITGDALWHDGFGMLNPWLDGEGVFDDAAAALDRLDALSPAPVAVIAGHGPPFADFAAAIGRARSRLAHLRARPDRLRHKVLRDYLGFFRLAHPDFPVEGLHRWVADAARDMPPRHGGDDAPVDVDAVVRAVVGR